MFGVVRYPTVLRVSDPSALGQFQDALRDEFPEFSEQQQLAFAIAPGNPPQQMISGRTFRFGTADGTWGVSLGPDSLTLEAGAGRYTSYESFSERFGRVWTAFASQFGPSRVLFQGLRYINHWEQDIDPRDWARLINPELLGPAGGEHLGEGLIYAVSELRFQRSDGLLHFRHGLAPAGPESANGYLLDFDYFTEVAPARLDAECLIERFDVFHGVIWDFFRWCLTEAAMEELRRADD